MTPLVEFDGAVCLLRRFLSDQRCPTDIRWAFREDLYQVGGVAPRVRWPLPADNESLARRLYTDGRGRGLGELIALCHVGGTSIVNAFMPQADEIQGWSQDLKVSVRRPFVQARPVTSRLSWRCHRMLSSYRRFQSLSIFISKRPAVSPSSAANGDGG